MASRGLTINFSRLAIYDPTTTPFDESYPTVSLIGDSVKDVFDGIEMDGRDLSLAGIEVGIDNNQKIFLTKDIDLTIVVGGDLILSGSFVNKTTTASPTKSIVALYSSVGELGIYIDQVYAYVIESFDGEQFRNTVTCRLRAGTPITTFTVTS